MTESPLLKFRRLANWLRDDRAAAAAEFALVVPVFLLLVFSTINGSLLLAAINQLHFATERAARCKSVDVGGNCTDADAYAKSFYHGPNLTGLAFTATAPACGNQVVGNGTFELVGGFSVTQVNLSASACYPAI